MKKQHIEAPSLAQHFEAPLDYVPEFGWVCGYSADAAFLDNALERYTRQTRPQRAAEGRPWVGLMLDLGSPAIGISDVPGLLHLRMRPDARPRFHLLHAKVALLGFRRQGNAGDWLLRLIVSTGNWTRQTVEESLDLAWRVEVRAEDLSAADSEKLKGVADMAAAWGFFEKLIPLFDDRLLKAQGAGSLALAAQARQRVENWLAACQGRRGKPKPRFFDTHQRSLLAQLPELVKEQAGQQRRNYLAMGSGFFEAPADGGAFPLVPLAIRERLAAADLLTKTPEVDVYVNPVRCQAMAKASDEALKATEMTIRAARAPAAIFGKTSARTLHAKFVFSANDWKEGDACASAWLYLGSGNLTEAGFRKAGPAGGNLEAGVVLGLPNLCWYAKDGRGPDLRAVENLLPVGWDDKELSLQQLAPGDPFPERTEETLAPPVPWLEWKPGTPGGVLRAPSLAMADGDIPDYEVLGLSGEPCERRGTAEFDWPGDRPLEVVLRWTPLGNEPRQDRVPVIDEYGRVAASPLPALDLESARWQLADFPNAPEPDDSDEDGAPDASGSTNGSTDAMGSAGARYAIRDLMGFIESVAERQTSIDEADWTAWCARFEQTLLQTATDPAIGIFKDMGLNPLQPLRLPAFRPAYAESNASDGGKRYEDILQKIEKAWRVAGLAPMGEQP